MDGAFPGPQGSLSGDAFRFALSDIVDVTDTHAAEDRHDEAGEPCKATGVARNSPYEKGNGSDGQNNGMNKSLFHNNVF